MFDDTIMPVLNIHGDPPPPLFPQDRRDIDNMEEPVVNELLNFYEIQHARRATLGAKIILLRRHLGFRA